MKTGQIIAITGGVIAGTLLLGGGAFAAGVALSNPIGDERIERVEQRLGERDELMQRFGQQREDSRERGHSESAERGFRSDQRGPGEHDCDEDHEAEHDRDQERAQRGRPDTAPTPATRANSLIPSLPGTARVGEAAVDALALCDSRMGR